MSSSDRRTVLIGLAGAVMSLSGCLRPLLAKDEAGQSLRSRIALPRVDDRFSYFLNDGLADRLGEPQTPDYRLAVTNVIESLGVAISEDYSATRTTLILRSSWQVVSLADGETVLKGKEILRSGYNSTSSLYATRQVRLDVERRLARQLAEKIAREIQARATTFTT